MRPVSALAEFELLVLLAVLQCGDEAYSVAVQDELQRRGRRPAAMGAIYVTLERLEDKGFLTSRLGRPLPQRGGRARRYFSPTAAGRAAVKDEVRIIRRMWAGLGLLTD